jgi:hypothetical protein
LGWIVGGKGIIWLHFGEVQPCVGLFCEVDEVDRVNEVGMGMVMLGDGSFRGGILVFGEALKTSTKELDALQETSDCGCVILQRK